MEKIEYTNKNVVVIDDIRRRSKKIIIVSLISIVMLCFLKILESIFKINEILILLMLGFVIAICVVLVLVWDCTIYNKKLVEEIKIKGKKKRAEIINIQTYEEWNSYHHKYSWLIDYGYDKIATMVLCYEGKTIRTGNIKVNKAYRILKLLLEPYPIKKLDKIYVDIYEYKKFVFADLEGLQLEKIEGYEEAIKLVEESIK